MLHNSFYAELPSFPQFSQFTEDHYYHALPSDWYLVISETNYQLGLRIGVIPIAELSAQGAKIEIARDETQDSLMTCYVDDINDGGHIHFIDGADGGYAMAAKQLKRQIKDA